MSQTDATRTRLRGVAPLFVVRDVLAASAYYRDVLGFTFEKIWGEPPCFCMPQRDGLIVMLSQVKCGPQGQLQQPQPRGGETWDAYFWCDDADALFAEMEPRGVRVEYRPLLREYYNNREFAIRDFDGYLLAFGSDASRK